MFCCLRVSSRYTPVAGKQVHDDDIVATMLAHGEHLLLTVNPAVFRLYGKRIALIPATVPQR